MKSCVTILFSLLCCFSIFGQSSNYHVDSRILSIPENRSTSTSDIAEYINTHFSHETDKARAAYTWVVNNMEYDTDSMYAINWNMGGNLKITESLRRRKGVCENFAGIFIDIITKAGLTGLTIDGYTKQSGYVNRTGHTWSAVLLDETWFLFDPTWDKDRKNDFQYFMVHPYSLANSHMPFDPLWQFTDLPVSHREFQGKGAGRSEALSNHRDSIKAFMRMRELEKLEATARRMEKSEKVSDLIKNRIAFVRMHIVTIHEERDMHIYNAAVSDLNMATAAYNKYNYKIQHLSDTSEAAQDYEVLLEPALRSLSAALTSVDDIGKFMPNYQYDPASMKIRIEEISEKIRRVKPLKETLSKNR